MIDIIIKTAAGILAEEQDFKAMLFVAPESERQGMIERRKAYRDAARVERERKEMLEALKPHNFWSFFGLGRK